MRESHTAVVERNVVLEGTFATEPYEVAWASEAIYFLRVLASPEIPIPAYIHLEYTVDISPDGIHWCSVPEATAAEVDFSPTQILQAIRIRHFGGWLRLSGTVSHRAKFMIYLALKE